jgi:hypothetical protein
MDLDRRDADEEEEEEVNDDVMDVDVEYSTQPPQKARRPKPPITGKCNKLAWEAAFTQFHKAHRGALVD